MKAFAIFALGLALRAAIILINPIIFGGDTIIRLVNRHNLAMGHQLPVLQALISLVSRISMNPILVRFMVATIGAAAGVAFYWLVQDLFGGTWAFPAALLFVTNPFLLALSTVPYQEIVMLAGLMFAFHFFYREQWLAASLSLGIACLTRYEAWAACPVLIASYAFDRRREWTEWLKGMLLYAWAPAAWIASSHGLTSGGSFVIERSTSLWRLQRELYLGWVTAKYTPITVVVLAVAGVWMLYRNRSLLTKRLIIQIVFVALFCISILFSAHGVMPDPERYVTAREAHITIYFVLLLAALGLSRWPRWTTAIVAFSAVLGVGGAFWLVKHATSQPDVQLTYELAKYLDSSVSDGESVLILAKPIPTDQIQEYLDKARATGGEEGLLQARLNLLEVDTSPEDYQRLLVHSRLGREHLLVPPAKCTQLVAVWSDYPDATRELADKNPVTVLRAGDKRVSILRNSCP